MKMILGSLLLSLPLIACSTARPVAGEIAGLEPLAAPCPNSPATLSDDEAAALVQAMPDASQRERQFWAPRALDARAYSMCERQRADDLVSLIARYNQIVRESAR